MNDVREVEVVIGKKAFERALRAARFEGVIRSGTDAMHAPLAVGLKGRIAAVWDRVEAALRTARELGLAAAQSLVDAATEAVSGLVREVGDQASAVIEELNCRLKAHLDDLVQEAMSSLKNTVTIGPTTLRLATVTVTKEIQLGAEVGASILSLCKLAATGKIAVTATYTAQS